MANLVIGARETSEGLALSFSDSGPGLSEAAEQYFGIMNAPNNPIYL